MKKYVAKMQYQTPIVERVFLDFEISLTLDSSLAPFEDPEVMLSSDPLLMDPGVM